MERAVTTPRGTDELPTRVWLEKESLSELERDSIDPVDFDELSDEERDIVRTALETGEYTAETTQEPSALGSLRGRIEKRTNGGDTLDVYLRRTSTYYRVGITTGDHIIAHLTTKRLHRATIAPRLGSLHVLSS